MNDASPFVQIGFILKPHGVKGEIKVSVEDAYFEDYIQADIVFIQDKHQFNPLFIEQVRSDMLITKFEGYETPESVRQIASRPLFLRESDLIPAEKRTIEVESSKYAQCIGYDVLDMEGSLLGNISDIEEFPQQKMAILNLNDKTAYLPLVDAFVKEINAAKKQIKVDIPEGLLDL